MLFWWKTKKEVTDHIKDGSRVPIKAKDDFLARLVLGGDLLGSHLLNLVFPPPDQGHLCSLQCGFEVPLRSSARTDAKPKAEVPSQLRLLLDFCVLA